jgi:hypothetical protein
MKLIDTRDKSIYAEFSEGKPPHFADSLVEKEMRLYGIEIPPRFRDQFDGKEFVVWADDDFPRAFREVYYFCNLDRRLFQWE